MICLSSIWFLFFPCLLSFPEMVLFHMDGHTVAFGGMKITVSVLHSARMGSPFFVHEVSGRPTSVLYLMGDEEHELQNNENLKTLLVVS